MASSAGAIIVSKPKSLRAMTTDHYRWIRANVGGLSLQDIADLDGVDINEVRASILRYDRKRAALTRDEMEARQIEAIQKNAAAQEAAIYRALTATRPVTIVENGEETVIREPDYDVQLRAVQAQISMVESLAPRGGSKVQVAIQNNNGRMRGSSAISDSMEDNLRAVIEKRKQLPTAVIEGNFEDAPDCIVRGSVPDDEGDIDPDDDDDDPGETFERGE